MPEYWNGEGRGYRIQYKSGAEEDFAKAMEVRNENANSYTFTNLEEWTEYDVRVAAFNQVGTSAYSSVATDRTIESGKSDLVGRLTFHLVIGELSKRKNLFYNFIIQFMIKKIWYINRKFFYLLVPSVGPSGVNATAMSSSTVSIKWSGIPALQQNGEVIGYKVRKPFKEFSIISTAAIEFFHCKLIYGCFQVL